MANLPKEKKEEIIAKLKERGANRACPMCGNSHFVLADAYFANMLQGKLGTVNISGEHIPTIPIICSNCGFVSQHAIGVLGLTQENQKEKEGDPKDDK